MKRAGLFPWGKAGLAFPFGFVFIAIGLICFGSGCTSSAKAALINQKDPIALVSMVSNLDIHWKDEEPVNPKGSNFLNRRALRSDPDLTVTLTAEELIITAETLFRNTMADSGLINLAEKEMVVFSPAYQNARINRYQEDWEMVKPENYRLVDFRDKSLFPVLASETGFQRFMFVEFYFTTAMGTGVGKLGTCLANTEMKVLILDAQGKTLFRKTVAEWSRSTIKVKNGVYSRTAMMDLFEAAILEACHEFLYQVTDY